MTISVEQAPSPSPRPGKQFKSKGDSTALRLRAAGFSPIPIRGKRPPMDEWQHLHEVPSEQIRAWAKEWPNAKSTGVLTKFTPAIDIDILDQKAVEAVEALAQKHFEQRGTVLARVGKAPKRLIPLRTDQPFKKITLNVVAPGGETGQKIEVLGDGQQFVAYGIHPDTGQPYRWFGGELTDIKWQELPHICTGDAEQFIAEAEKVLAEHGYTPASARPKKKNDSSNHYERYGAEVTGGRAEDWQWLIDNIHEGRELHDSLRDLGAKMVMSGMAAGAVVNFLRGVMEGSTAPRDGRWQDRYNDIPRLVEGAEELRKQPSDEPKTNGRSNEIGLVCAADVEMKNIDWLWRNHLARGKLTMLSGPSELGKSTISADLAARLSQEGSKWPDGDQAPFGSTITLSSEDAINDTIVPRLTAAGANLKHIYCLAFVKTDGVTRTFSLQTDLQRLGEKIRAIGNVLLVIIDPVTSYMGTKIDSHRTTDVRGVLEPLQKFAEEYNVAVLMISHPQKAPATKALNAVTGSAAFVHTPRMQFLCIQDPECKDTVNPRVLFLAGKNNIGKKAKGMGYRTASVFVGPGESILTSRIEWDDLPVHMTANQALEAEAEKKKGTATKDAEEFLETRLANGPLPAKDIKEEAEANGISERTLARARKRLHVKAEKAGYEAGWTWSLGFRIVGPAVEPGATCIQCHSAEGTVLKIKNRKEIGGKPETLHEACAEAWFAKAAPTTDPKLGPGSRPVRGFGEAFGKGAKTPKDATSKAAN